MKKLLVLLFSLFALTVNASDVYYCSDDNKTGFDVSENFKHKMFNEDKYKIMIDFDKREIISEKLYFKSNIQQKCFLNYTSPNQTLYCLNMMGSAFSINMLTLEYILADVYNIKNAESDPVLSYGTCEKF